MPPSRLHAMRRKFALRHAVNPETGQSLAYAIAAPFEPSTCREPMMPNIDWAQMFTFTVSPIELFIRGTLTFLFLFCLFRFVVHRDVGGLGVSDLLVLVIIADASQNAMAGEYHSIVDGFVLIGTIIGWSWLLNYLSFLFEPVRRFALPRPICLIKDGIKQERNLRQELIADEELKEMLREHEIENIAEVRRAYLEPDGQITVFRKRGTKSAASNPPDRNKAI
jgi:uncharacterized membrane protein YcaP (DUF421 family)